MQLKQRMRSLTFATYLLKPIEKNKLFFVFMLLVGAITHISHRNLWGYIELLADVYWLCAILSIFKSTLRRVLRFVLSCGIYAIAIADAGCKTLFGTPLSPTMLLLAQETTGRESAEFCSQYIKPEILFSTVGIILLLALCHAFMAIRKTQIKDHFLRHHLISFSLFISILIGTTISLFDKIQLYSAKNLSELEVAVVNGFAHIYHPVERVAYGLYTNYLIGKQVKGVIKANTMVAVDSCKFTSPTIVLIIGESANRHHSQLYGYNKPTTPNQLAMMKGKDSLAVFTDVIAPWNLTSRVFKQIFSLQSVGDKTDWSEVALFPALFKKAGYRVSFLSNQFPYGVNYTPDWVNNLSGGFFLNHPQLNEQMFDDRNANIHEYDDELLSDYQAIVGKKRQPQLVIFHLLGQHFQYSMRCKPTMAKFGISDYPRKDLTNEEKETIAQYDNATLYNDFVLSKIVEQFRNENAIVIYLSDHGEECYGKDVRMAGRLTEVEQIDVKKYHEEFEIPFWIWCSPVYKATHHELFKQIHQARTNKFMTDDLPHLLFYLAGIETKTYKADRCMLTPQYNKQRSRKVLNRIDYDVAMRQ